MGKYSSYPLTHAQHTRVVWVLTDHLQRRTCSQTNAGVLSLLVEGRTYHSLQWEPLRGLWKEGLEKQLSGLYWMPMRHEQFGISETLVQEEQIEAG